MTERTERTERVTSALVALIGGLCLSVGFIALAGWHTHHPLWIRLGAPFPPLQYAVALGLVFAGLSLVAVAVNRSRPALIAAAVVFALSTLRLVEYAFQMDLGVDRLLPDPYLLMQGVPPGRLPLMSAFGFILIATGVGIAAARLRFKCRPLIVASLGAVAAAIATTVLIAHAAGVIPSQRWSPLTVLAPQLTLAFVLLGLGVMILAWREEIRRHGNAMRWLPVPVGIALIVATLLLWQALLAQERDHVNRIMQAELNSVANKIASNVQAHVLALLHMAGEWEAGGRPNRRDWNLDSAIALSPMSGFRSVAWIDPTARVQRIMPVSDNKGTIRAVSAGAVGHKAQDMARRLRRAVLVAIEDQGATNVLVYVPLFDAGRFDGYLVGVFRLETLFGQMIDMNAERGYAIRMLQDGHELYARSIAGQSYVSTWSQERPLDLYDADWRLQIVPSRALADQLHSRVPTAVLIAGLLTSILFSFVLFLGETARARSRDVDAMNRSLRREIEERSRTEQRFRGLIESAPDAMVIVDTQGRIVLSNSRAETLFGYQAKELLQESIALLIPERFRARHAPHVQGYLRKPDTRPMGAGLELYGLHKNGNEFPVEISLAPLTTHEGLVVSASIRDVTERRRREEALRQSEERFRLVLEAVQDYAIFLLDPNGHVASWNAGAERITGYRGDEIIGRHFQCFFTPEDVAADRPQEELAVARANGRVETEAERVRKDGTRFWCSVTLTPVRDATGGLRGYSKITRDITERKSAETALREQHDLIRLLHDVALAANEAATIDTAMQVALDRVCALTEWPVGHLCMGRREDSEHLWSTSVWHLEDRAQYEDLVGASEGLVFDRGLGLPGHVLATGDATYVTSLSECANSPRRSVAERLGIKAVFAFPVLVKSRVVGVLEFFSPKPLQPHPALLSVMAQIGTQLGRVVERKWAEETVRESESRFRSVTESASDAVISVDGVGRIITWNRGAAVIFGYDAEEIIGKRVTCLLPARHHVRLSALAAALGLTSRLMQRPTELHGVRRDGSEFPMEISLASWRTSEGIFYSGIARDITARKQAEAKIRELNDDLERRVVERTAQAEQALARLAFLAEASGVLSSSLDYADTLARVARLAVPYLADWCLVDIREDSGAIRRVKAAHADPEMEAFGRELQQRYPVDPDRAHGPAQVMRTGEAELVPEISATMLAAQARDSEHLATIQTLGLRSYMCVPLVSRDRILGAITFISGKAGHRYDPADLALAQDLARRCAAAVDNARLYQAAQDEIVERRRAEKEIRFQAHLLSVVGQAVIATDVRGRIIYANAFVEQLYGWRPDEMQGRPILDIVAMEDREQSREILGQLRAGEGWAGELRVCHRDNPTFIASVTNAPIYDDGGHLIGMISVSSDITERKDAEKLIRERARQQEAVARLGQSALEGLSLSQLLDEAVSTAAANLDVEMCKILELLPDGERLLLRAGVGWRAGLVGQATVGADLDSQAGYTLASKDPVIVYDLRTETRFTGPALLAEHAVVSGISVTIPLRDRAFGVLGAHAPRLRHFTKDDVHFLESIANVLASAIERQRTDEERTELLVHEHAARLEAEAARIETEEARQRMALLAEASSLFALSFDFLTTLDKLVHLAVPALADWCAVDLHEDGEYRRVAAAHTDVAKVNAIYELQARYPADPNLDVGYPKVGRTGEPDLWPDVSDELLGSHAKSDEHLRLLRELGFRSFMCVPLIVRGQTLGTITLVHADSGRRFQQADLTLALDLAGRAALAIDNARLYHAAQQEILERRRAEELLADEKERLAVTLHSIGDGVITTDRDGRIVLLNKIAEELTGWRRDEAAGRRLDEVFYIINERTREPCDNPVDKVLKTGQIIGLANHTALIAKDGTERVIADSGAPIRDRQGDTVGVVLVFRDISEQQKMEEDLQKSQKLESIGILAGGIAHDFNNILTAILGNISLARMYAEPGDKMSEVLSDAESAFWRARDLTQQLLTFSKGGSPIKKTASIGELLRDTCGFVLSGSNVRCQLELPEDLWAAQFDVGQISQVINNLLINAQQAMPEGGVVVVRAENVYIGKRARVPLAKGRYIKISIRDHGVGIPEENLTRIFDPYFTTKQTGSGLGLATSYSIVKRHDGYIEVQSQVGKGTCFSVYLPASADSLTAEAARTHDELTGQGRILFMDDEEAVRRVGGEILKRLGYEVEFAAEGVEMLERYIEAKREARSFDAVVMDLTIPGGLGGKEAITRLLEVDPDAVAVVSSGYFNDPVMADFARYGFRGVIAKPYKVKELSKVIYDAIKGKQRE
jgi:PAS domain S-box-containing protein